jgi:hypothetical protein
MKFVIGNRKPVDSKRDPVAERATNEVVEVAWAVVDKLCAESGEALSRSFGNFDRIVALGWLISDAIGILGFERSSAYLVGLKAYKLAQALPQQISDATKPLRRRLSKLAGDDHPARQQLALEIAQTRTAVLQKPFTHELLVHRKRQRTRSLPIEEQVAAAKAKFDAARAKMHEMSAAAKKEIADLDALLPRMKLWYEDRAAYESKRRRYTQAFERAEAAKVASDEAGSACSAAGSMYLEVLGRWEQHDAELEEEERRLAAEWDDDMSPSEIAAVLENMVAAVAISSAGFAHCELRAMALIERADTFGCQEMDQMQEALRRGLPPLPPYPPVLRDAHERSLPFGLSFMGHVSAIAWQHAVQSVNALEPCTAGVLTPSGHAVMLQMLSDHHAVAAWELSEWDKAHTALGL